MDMSDSQSFPEQHQITQRSSGNPPPCKDEHLATQTYIQLAGWWQSINDLAVSLPIHF